ncbi:MAG: sigma 54-interacting transcriptional regulator [Syntrophomonadaceae bacterium]|nr:sigma 54-interacting transcriptional regulator [Syntrophomonadaceae bacterium]
MKIHDVMSDKLFTINAHSSVEETAALFLEHGIDGAPVVDEDLKLLGLVTKVDLYRAIVTKQPLGLPVKEIMKTEVVTLDEEMPIQIINDLDFGRYPVLRKGRVTGMLTKSDANNVFTQELRDIGNQMQAVLDAAYNSIVSIDEGRRIRIFNRAAEELFDMKKEDVLGVLYTDAFPKGVLTDILDTGSVVKSRKFKYKDKTIVSNLTPILKDDGGIGGAVAVAQDISDLENISKELTSAREMKEKLDTLLGESLDSFFVADKDGKVINVNKAYTRITGLKAEDILGRSMYELVEKGYYSQAATLMVLESHKPVMYKETTATGRVALFTGLPIFDEQGELCNVLVNIKDITDLESVSGELEKTQELKDELNTVIQASFDGICQTDAEATILIVNDAYVRITGMSREELIGKNMKQLVRDGYYDCSVSLMVIEQGKQVTIEQKLKTGKKLLVTGNPVFNDRGELIRVITNARDLTELDKLRQEIEQAQGLSRHYQEELQKMKISEEGNFIAESRQSKDVIDLIVRVGKADSTVLIQGESGVGKEIVARELHKHSPRCNLPYIKINCTTIPENLLESELFGYESGAFTGAKKGGKSGIFELANQGSLFLDEIGEIPLHIQVKLLRVLQESEFTRVGGTKPIKVDVRVIAATNRNLNKMVAAGSFREDLFYRLNVIPIYVSPLRERKEEIAPLVRHFLKMFNEKYSFNKTITASALGLLMDYDWPGNIRELRNVIERAVVTSTTTVIDNFSFLTQDGDEKHENRDTDCRPVNLKHEVEEFEKQMILKYVEKYGSLRKAAHSLGASKTTLWRKASQYGIHLGDKP